ncbi:MAG TPA: hypothetical protein VGH10_06595 [Actinomycetota bacterium]
MSADDPTPERPAFYTLAPGGWRDWWSLLHPPYTVWMLSYVALGAVTATALDLGLLGLTVAGFFLGVGVTAHALDELKGRPLGTRLPDGALWTAALVALAGAVALGIYGGTLVGWWVLAFIGFGTFIVLAYNLELFGGAFHSDLWFALAWGAFPALTGAFAQSGNLRWAAIPVAAACAAASWAQRVLSTPVRRLRREVVRVDGALTLGDGRAEPLSAASLRAAPEGALRALSLAMPLLAGGLVLARVG